MSTETTVIENISINFRENVPAGQGVRVTQNFHYAGKIKQVLFHFPPGCAGLVRVRLLKDEKPFYPIQGYLALDNSTPAFPMDEDYYSFEPLTLEIENTDASFPHTISCVVAIEYKRSEPLG